MNYENGVTGVEVNILESIGSLLNFTLDYREIMIDVDLADEKQEMINALQNGDNIFIGGVSYAIDSLDDHGTRYTFAFDVSELINFV